ncbi:hypothetical protein H4R27_006283 [Coemansia aciculifera]|nr:hypothetical protein H4R27_006283 [Coemansia aciculifera]
MRMWRSAITIPPSATLDERIRGLFPPGAMYDCLPESMDTLVERRMRQMSSDIRSKSDWLETIYDANTRAGWAAEAKAKELTDVEFAYVLDELVYYASLHPPVSNIRLSAADGVWFSDTLIDAEITSKFKNYADILESVPDRLKDYYPNDHSRVLNLIDPSLFPLIYSRSKLRHYASTSPQILLGLENAGEFPGSLDEWRKALSVTKDGESDYYLPIGDRQYVSYSSDIISWLPSEFRVDDNGFELGSVSIEDGRCVVFPNIHQFKLPELKLADKTKPGHCKMLTFYFVDPSTRIPSTEIVPPQQQDWYFEDTLASEPFRSLPQLVVDGVMAKIDFPISLKEAKKSRLHIHEDESRKGVISDLYEPRILFSS